MKNYSGFFFIFLCIAVILSTGCISPGTTSAAPVATPTPQIVYVTVLVTQIPTPAFAVPTTKYTMGDIVWSSGNNYDTDIKSLRGINIVGIDGASYNVQYVWKDDGETHWSRVYPNIQKFDIDTIESRYPQIVDHVAASTITSDYSSKAAYDAAISGSSSSGSSSSQTLSGSGDDTKSFSVTGSGGFLVAGSYSGKSNFIVHIVDKNGDIEEFLFNVIGSYSGKKIVHLDPGTHYLEVQASGPWSITFTPA